jgi:putative RecB family exonuclease
MIGTMAELPSHLSPSSAATFEQCPRRWRFKHVDQQPEPSGQAALVGSFSHRVLELLCGLPPLHRTVDQAKALAKEVWPDFAEDPDYVTLDLDEAGARAFRWQAWLSSAGLWDIEDPALVDVVATEQKVVVELDQVPFVGIIDRVDRHDDRLIVTDYKSGLLPGSRWRADKLHQVMLYAAALTRAGRGQPDRARLLYLGQRIVEVAVTDRRIEEAEAKLAGTWDCVTTACANEVFDAKPTVLCGWCPFANQCPEGKAELESRAAAGTLPSHAPAAELVATS